MVLPKTQRSAGGVIKRGKACAKAWEMPKGTAKGNEGSDGRHSPLGGRGSDRRRGTAAIAAAPSGVGGCRGHGAMVMGATTTHHTPTTHGPNAACFLFHHFVRVPWRCKRERKATRMVGIVDHPIGSKAAPAQTHNKTQKIPVVCASHVENPPRMFHYKNSGRGPARAHVLFLDRCSLSE